VIKKINGKRQSFDAVTIELDSIDYIDFIPGLTTVTYLIQYTQLYNYTQL